MLFLTGRMILNQGDSCQFLGQPFCKFSVQWPSCDYTEPIQIPLCNSSSSPVESALTPATRYNQKLQTSNKQFRFPDWTAYCLCANTWLQKKNGNLSLLIWSMQMNWKTLDNYQRTHSKVLINWQSPSTLPMDVAPTFLLFFSSMPSLFVGLPELVNKSTRWDTYWNILLVYL